MASSDLACVVRSMRTRRSSTARAVDGGGLPRPGQLPACPEAVLGIPAEVLSRVGWLELDESALHAPAAVFGGVEFYPDLARKAAVLASRLIGNHPLADGNRRVSYLSAVGFVARNGGPWTNDDPDGDETIARASQGVAAGAIGEETVWMAERLKRPSLRCSQVHLAAVRRPSDNPDPVTRRHDREQHGALTDVHPLGSPGRIVPGSDRARPSRPRLTSSRHLRPRGRVWTTRGSE